MKAKWHQFYESKYFIPTIAIIWIAVGTMIIYALFEHFHLWFTLLLIVGFVIFIKLLEIAIRLFMSIF